MSQLEKRKSRLVLTTESAVRHGRRSKKVMLELKPGFAYVWLSGSRTKFVIDYQSIYERAAWLQARAKQLEKARAKKEAKEGRRRK